MTSHNFLRLAGWAAFLGAVTSLFGTIAGILWVINGFSYSWGGVIVIDTLAVVVPALMLPVALALYLILRSQAPTLSLAATAVGILCLLVYGTTQALLVADVFTFEQVSVPNLAANAGIGIWLLLTNYAALRDKVFPRGLAWAGIVTGAGFVVIVLGYLLYPIWAIWLGRWLLTKPHGELNTVRSS